MKNIFILILFIGIWVPVIAQDIVTDRPDQTESSSAVERGSFQIESGILIEYTEDNISTSRQILAPTTLFRYGILNGIEIRVLSQFESVNRTTTSEKFEGMSDLEIGTKINLLNKENISTEIAFLSHLILPTGSKNLTNDKVGMNNKFSVSHALNKNLSLGYNVGYTYMGEGNGDLTYSLALGISINSNFGIYVEPYGRFAEVDKHESNFDAGITYLVKNNLQLDFSFGTGINNSMNYLSVGCSINIAKEEN